MSALVDRVMDGFDGMNMPYLPGTISLDQVSVAGYMNNLPTMGMHESSTAFDEKSYIGNEISSFIPPALPYNTMRRYSSVPEDIFSDTASQYDSLPQDQSLQESPSVERDNKLLRFSPLTVDFSLLDFSFTPVPFLSLTAQLQGSNFFLAESPWASSAEANLPPPELTCYRRNIFQVVGSITLPRTMHYIVTNQGERIRIHTKELSISATESVGGNPVKIITVPWKSSTSTAASNPEEKIEMEPPPILLDTVTAQDADTDFATFPIAWKRLQFRIATANNGRRKELQQHFSIRLKVIATLETGSKVSICESTSCAIIVRGRSPRNFQQRKDLPITGPGSSMRNAMQPPSLLTRTSSSESLTWHNRLKHEQSPETALDSFQYSPTANPLPQTTDSPNFIDWTQVPRGASSSLTALPTPPFTTTTAMTTPHLPAYARSSPDLARHHPITSHPSDSLPLPLSLTDSPPPPSKRTRLFKHPRRTSHPAKPTTTTTTPLPATSPHSPFKQQRPHLTPPPASLLQSHTSIGSDAADLLYEYFPLGLDDWMPPVDAVYRPHVVHHTNLPREASAAKVGAGGRGKRLYSECEA